MIKIIDRKRYNTETARLLAHWRSDHYCNDFSYYEEWLYVSKKGNFFLYGEGNANSRWSEPCGNMRGSGSGIKPLTQGEAMEWAEAKEETEVCEREFADMIEDA